MSTPGISVSQPFLQLLEPQSHTLSLGTSLLWIPCDYKSHWPLLLPSPCLYPSGKIHTCPRAYLFYYRSTNTSRKKMSKLQGHTSKHQAWEHKNVTEPKEPRHWGISHRWHWANAILHIKGKTNLKTHTEAQDILDRKHSLEQEKRCWQ